MEGLTRGKVMLLACVAFLWGWSNKLLPSNCVVLSTSWLELGLAGDHELSSDKLKIEKQMMMQQNIMTICIAMTPV